MTRKSSNPCPECQRLRGQVEALQEQVTTLASTIEQLKEQLAKAKKDSSSSSKPPSSDIVKPPKPPPPEGQEKRSIGGQPGHPRHERPLLPPEQLTGGSHDHLIEICPSCGSGLEETQTPPRVVQQLEIPVVPLLATEHVAHAGWCPHCQTIHYATLPPSVERAGLVGPRLTALIAYLKGVCHASFSTIRKYLRDIVQVTISRGQLSNIIAKVSQALDVPYQELLNRLSTQSRLNVDETGHRDQGERWWTWCFRASMYTLYKIDSRRSGDVLLETLGAEFSGVLGCDYFSAYRRYMRECSIVVQFCLAHLIRDVKFLLTLPDARDRDYGQRLKTALRGLFAVIHGRDEMGPRVFTRELRAARDEVLEQASQAPPTRQSQNIAQRFAKHGEAYFEFVTTPGVEPTNNLAEQAIRFVVIDRLITQGTRGEKGRRWCERIWTVMATCCQQGRSVIGYLEKAVEALFTEAPAPSLLSTEN